MYTTVKDEYKQGPRRKAHGYPQGQWAKFLHGRLLRNCEYGYSNLFILTAPAATSGGRTHFRTTAPRRALYIPWVMATTSMDYTDNVLTSWQLWANGEIIASGMCGQYRADVGVYIPPESDVSMYLRCVNGSAANACNGYLVPWYEFDSEVDIWEFGSGGNRENPRTVGRIPVWP